MKKIYALILISIYSVTSFAGNCPQFITGSDATVCSGSTINLNTLVGGNITNPLLWRIGALYGTPTSNTVTPVAMTVYFAIDSNPANGCWDSTMVTIFISSALTVSAAVTSNYNGADISCQGATDGSAQATANGGFGDYDYLWSASAGNQTNDVANNLGAGVHSVTVTDENNCTASTSVTLVSPSAITVNTSLGTILCHGGTTTVTVTATGGSGHYIGTGTFVVIAGSFTYNVTDANGCTGSTTIIVPEPSAVVADAVMSQAVNCNGGNNGSAYVNASGGTLGYSYLWSANAGGQTTPGASNLTEDTYSVTVTDANGCTTSDDVFVSKDPSPYVFLGPATTQCGGVLTFDAGVGSGNLIYAWSNGPVTQTTTVSSSGTYGVTVSDPSGCTATASVDAYILPSPVVYLGPDVYQCGGTVTLDATTGTGSTYAWSATTDTLPTHTVSSTGLYSVTVTNSGSGCTASDVINVTIYTVPVANLGNDSVQCGGTITLNAGNNGANYLWSDNSTNQTLVVSNSGIYRLTVTSNDGCVSIDDITITIKPAPSLGPNQTDSICAGVTFNLTTQNYNGFSPQVWDAATPTSVTGGIFEGIYTAPNGCTDTVYQQVVVKPSPFTPIFLTGQSEVCAGSLDVPYSVNQDDAVTYDWSYDGFGVQFDNMTSSNTLDFAHDATDGTITVLANAKNGCGTAMATFRVHILFNPIISLISTDADNSICFGQRISYTASGGDSYVWIVNGKVVDNETDNVFDFSPAGNGTYTIIAVAFNACGNDSSNTELLDVYETPIVNAGADTSIGLGTSVMLHGSATVTAPFVYNWTPATTLNDAAAANPIATPTDSTLYTLTVSNQFGCVASDDVFVSVFRDGIYDFPNLITPNGDGANDVWKIDLDEIPDGNVVIFTRWGEVVYENPSYDNTWDGTLKGKALDDGTYYFVMKSPSLGNKVYKGAINIIRSAK